jgi:low temperature requirement protein LtrA
VSLRALLIAAYLWHASTDPQARSLCLRYAFGFSVGASIWLASLAVPAAIRWTVWICALGVEIVTPVIAHVRTTRVPLHTSHMPERFGLFTLIVLGEAVLAVATGPQRAHGSAGPLAVAIAGFILAGALWWAYFRHADEKVISQALAGGRRELLLSYVYGYAHLVIFASIAATGVGVALSIDAAAGLRPDRPAVLLVAGGVAAFLVASTVAHWATPRSLPARAVAARCLAAALLIIGSLLVPMAPSALAVALSAVAVLAVQYFSVEQDATIGHAGRLADFSPDPPS